MIPFDFRWIYYNKLLLQRHLYDIMKNLFDKENIALITVREITSEVFNHVFITDKLMDRDPLSGYVGERSYAFSLYLYKENHLTNDTDKILNIKKSFISFLRKNYYNNDDQVNASQIARDFIYYPYGLLNNPIYKEKYNEFIQCLYQNYFIF